VFRASAYRIPGYRIVSRLIIRGTSLMSVRRRLDAGTYERRDALKNVLLTRPEQSRVVQDEAVILFMGLN